MSAPLPSGVPADLGPRLRLVQVIWLVVTAVLLAALVSVGVLCEPRDPTATSLALSRVAVFLVLVDGVLAFVLPDWQVARSNPELRGTFELYRAGRMVQAGYLIAAGVVVAIAYRDEGQWWVLVAGGVVVLLLLVGTPTRERAERWFRQRSQPSA